MKVKNNKIKKIVNSFISVLLCAVLVSGCFFGSYSCAGGIIIGDTYDVEELYDWFQNDFIDLLEKGADTAYNVFFYLLGSAGLVVNRADYISYIENNDAFMSAIKSIWGSDSITIDSDDDGEITSVLFSSDIVDLLISYLEAYVSDTGAASYTLKKTVALDDIPYSYFTYMSMYYTLYNFLKQSESGIVAFGIYPSSSTKAWFDDLPTGSFYAYNGSSSTIEGVSVPYILLCDSTSSYITTSEYTFSFSSDEASDAYTSISAGMENTGRYCLFSKDEYTTLVDLGVNPFSKNSLVMVSLTEMSVPVYSSRDSIVSYSVEKALYYTGSTYTGAGVDVTIDLSTLNDIFDGAYSDIYDLLQELIEQSGIDNTDYETLQALVDEALSSVISALDDTVEAVDDVTEAVNISNKWLEKIYDRLGNMYTTLKSMLTQLKKIKTYTALDTLFDGLDFLADLADFISSFFSYPAVMVASLSGSLSEAADALSGKFPFSIPWDMAFLIGFLAETPETPVFEIPLAVESMGISETLTIDFESFAAVSKISRLLLTMIFIIGLLKLTEKIVNMKGGD